MKTFVIIGAGPGMGLATAERFAREGFRVVLAARSAARLGEMAEGLRAKGAECDIAVSDASDAGSIQKLIADVFRKYGSLDVLHYNAASLRQATIEDQPAGTFSQDLSINIGGALVAIQAVLPHMSSSKSGTILLTGGGLGLNPSPDYLSVSIGKAGLRAMTLALFEALKKRGIHIAIVNVFAYVQPGSQEATDIAERFWQLHCSELSDWQAKTAYP
ncbi:MAG: SDR family oxidoreductase [Acetobacteraceae bacterium]|nr:SDR family oxidoreductase [Acetobacteraceae bacterium]